MRKFSDEAFREIISELFVQKLSCSETLLAVIDEVYRKRIRSWCFTHRDVIDGGYAEDILQVIKIKIITNCTTSFFMKNGTDGGINTNPDEFASWMNTVVKNKLKDILEIHQRRNNTVRPIGDNEEFVDPLYQDSAAVDAQQEILSNAFAVVINADSDAHIVLTWIASSLFIYQYGSESCHVAGDLVEAFEAKTLYEMRDMLLRAAERLPWLTLSRHQLQKLNASLQKNFDGTRCCGEVQYREFFMKSGGKSSISNWRNRMNNLVKRAMKS
ncbi:MAG: hypothetical protein ACI4V3_06970 [Faecousia sp.]